MPIILTVIAGPHKKGLEFSFNRHDTFLVGRSRHAHFQLQAKDRFFSRIHFMLEVNPPQCRLIDMGSHNGTFVNGEKVLAADLKDGDEIRAGHTVLRVKVGAHEPRTPANHHPEEIAAGTVPVVPGYQLLRELGRGAMGVTYLGQRENELEPYNIKVVQPSFPGSPEQVTEFLQAVRALSQLDHPHIIRLREVGICARGFYFVSDYTTGQNVLELLHKGKPVSIKCMVRLANQLLLALHYAHAKQFVHCDIKPANVFIVGSEGKETVQLGDFGLARIYQAAPFSGLSLTSAMLNNAPFLPPEVLFNYQEVNPLADQYSVAAVLYLLLTGEQVLEIPMDTQSRFSSLLRRQHVPIRDRREDVSPALAEVIHRALSRTPQQRFKNIGEFRQALIRAVQGD